jgi:hypothetical protein
MSIYLTNIFLMIITAFFLSNDTNIKNWKKIFVIVASFQWIILSGFRHVSIGADTNTYRMSFYDAINKSWNEIFERFYDIYILGLPGKDQGYSVFEKLATLVSTDYQVYLIIIALLFTIPLGKWIYENSKDPFISFLIYSVLFYAFFAITGHRQVIATAMVVLIGYKYIKERRLLPFLLLTLVAFTIHKSALIFLPFYFIANKKITKTYMLTMIILFIILFISKEYFSTMLKIFGGYEIYGINKEAGTNTFTMIFLLLTSVAFWRYKKIISKSPQAIHFYNALLLALIFIPLTFVNPSAMRIVQYFSIFIILLIPEIIYSFRARERILIYYSMSSILIALLVKSSPTYLFFWE